MRQLFLRDARAGIRYRDSNEVTVRGRRHGNLSSARRKLDRVSDEVREHLADALGVSADGRNLLRHRDGELEPCLLHERTHRLQRPFDQHRRIDRQLIHRQASRLDARHVEQILDEPIHL